MRTLSWWLAGSLALMALGCGGNQSNSPLAPTNLPLSPEGTTIPGAVSGQGALGTAYQTGLNTQSALAIYTIDVDPVALTATSHLKETRAAQANDDLYLLSIDSFLTASSFQITGLSSTATTIDLTYSVAHPFPAANPGTGTPNGSTNRADLGVAGMVLFLADVPAAAGNTYFTDRVANTELVVNADAYYSPAGLISVTGTANTFPYRQLVDETTGGTGSRVGQSNSGNTGGNFGSDGWTRAEWGAGNNAWTGYGVLHQGQTSTNVLSLDRNALAAGFSLDTAIIAKYNDPRGGANAAQKKANRLPPTGPDATLFAYRMPHGALDVQKIEFGGESGGFFTNEISGSILNFRVEDWDARATESAEADLALDASFTNVAQGESGVPTIDVCIPGVLGDATTVVAMTTVVDDDTAMGGDAAQDSGAAGDGIFFSESVSKTVTSGQTDGTYTGMVRATDPETGLVVPLDATTLLPLGSNLPVPVTYQAFTVDLITPNIAPTFTANVPGTVNHGCALTIQILGIDDADLDDVDILVDWDYDGIFTLAQTVMSPYPALVQLTSPITYSHVGPAPDTRQLPIKLNDGTIDANLTPTPTVIVNPPCPNLAYAGTNLSGFEGFWDYVWYGSVNGSATVPADHAIWPITSIGPLTGITGGFVSQINNGTAPNSNELTVAAWNAASTPGTPQGIYLLTNLQAAIDYKMHQYEVGSDQRVFFARLSSAYPTASAGVSPLTTYDAALGAQSNISWFDYTSGVAATSVNTISTGTDRVIAMTLDQANNLYWIDQNHIMHRNLKANAYAEDTGCPWPVNMASAIGTNAGTGDANRKVADFICDYRNNAFFILTVSQGASPNMRVHRMECDGTFSPTIAGNPNPVQFAGNSGTTQTNQYDISIDQLDSTGAVLATQGEAQIWVTSYPGAPANQMFINANMQQYFSGGVFGNVTPRQVSLLNNWQSWNYLNGGPWLVYRPGATFPTGWYTGWQ